MGFSFDNVGFKAQMRALFEKPGLSMDNWFFFLRLCFI